MFSEFSENATFTGNDAFSTGEQILIFYEIENVDRGNNLITLVGYFLVVNLVACVVLVLRYNLFAGKIEAPTEAMEQASAHHLSSSHDQGGDKQTNGADEDGPEAVEAKNPNTIRGGDF